jgi:hypothetical protein
LLSSGVGLLSGAGPQLDPKATALEAVEYDEVDPLLGQPLPKTANVASSVVSDEEKAAMQDEDRAKSAAYAAVEAKNKAQKQLYAFVPHVSLDSSELFAATWIAF